MVEYSYGQEVVIVGNTLIKHSFQKGQVCKIEGLWSRNRSGYPVYKMYYMTEKGKHRQIISAADVVPLDVGSNEVALGFLEAKSPW